MGSQLQTSAQMQGSAWDQGPGLRPPSPAPRRPIDLVPENSSNNRGILIFHIRLESQPDHRSEGRPAASELKVAKSAFPEGQPLPRLLVKEPRVAAPASCRTVPHLGRTSLFFWKTPRRARARLSNGAHLGRGADQCPRPQVSCHSKAVQCGSTEPAAVMWEPSPRKDAARDRVNDVCLKATERLQRFWKAAGAKSHQAGARHVRQASY